VKSGVLVDLVGIGGNAGQYISGSSETSDEEEAERSGMSVGGLEAMPSSIISRSHASKARGWKYPPFGVV
jgi:hypothetical protein